MNNRIKELMNQTGIPTTIPFDRWCEKFAALIIEETVKQTCESFDAQSEYNWRLKDMMEHFGIKQ